MSVQITVSDDFKGVVDKIQKAKKFGTAGEAVDYIGRTFVARFKALKNYAEKQKNGKPAPKAKKAKAKKA